MNMNRRQFIQNIGFGAAALSAAGLLPSNVWAARGYSKALRRSEPEAQGVASAGILDFINAVESARLNLHSYMVVRHGCVVAGGWWAPYAPDRKHSLYSLSKSYTSTAVGLAVSEGRLRLEDKVISFFPDDLPSQVSPNLAAMRVKDLLMMGSGHAGCALFNPNVSLDTRNWVKAVLAQPVVFTPGTHFVYNNGATFLLSAIVQKVTGLTVFEYLTPRLFGPLGIEGVDWELNPAGINNGAWGLRVHTEDIAKLGQLYLQKGVWNGKQILPESWVDQATSKQIENAAPGDQAARENSDWAQGYGFQFWRCRNDAFRGDGAYGQYCIVLPGQDAVIAITSETNDMQSILNQVWKHLLPALHGEGVTNDGKALAALKHKQTSLMLPFPAGQSASPIAAQFNRKTYAIADNPLAVKSVSVQFRHKECIFKLWDDTGEHSVVCGFNRWLEGSVSLPIKELFLVTTNPRQAMKVAASAAWSDDRTLVMFWRFYETAHYERVTCRFSDNDVQVEFTRSLSIIDPNNKDPRPVLTGKLQMETA
jgi:CubicO group peptidase (beta-lactamase class C family)